jgi:hypothetical protein
MVTQEGLPALVVVQVQLWRAPGAVRLSLGPSVLPRRLLPTSVPALLLTLGFSEEVEVHPFTQVLAFSWILVTASSVEARVVASVSGALAPLLLSIPMTFLRTCLTARRLCHSWPQNLYRLPSPVVSGHRQSIPR